MTAWVSRIAVAGLCGVASLAVGSASASADGDFAFTDPAITESSGLVALPTRVVTVNDSGNEPLLFLVSRLTGETVASVRFTPDETVDVEALSPGASPTVIWVGDIGDNTESRDFVTLYRTSVPEPGSQLPPAARYRVRYSDGPHDAEALMIDPQGRVVIASKGAFSGKLYRSDGPPSLSRTTVVRPIARVPGLVTDGALSADGSVLYLRTYGVLLGYTYPGLDHLGTVALPPQPQGEALARDDESHLLVSSEGVGEAVIRFELPRALRPAASPTPEPSEPAGSPSSEPPPPGEGSDGSWLRWWPAAAGTAVLAALAGLFRGARRRSRRTR